MHSGEWADHKVPPSDRSEKERCPRNLVLDRSTPNLFLHEDYYSL